MLALFAAGIALRLVFMLLYRPAFLGIADTGSYLYAAHFGLFTNVYDPAGYPVFVRIAHALYPHLSLLIAMQHALGVGTAALWYLAVRRVSGSTLLGLVPAVIVLFDGYGLWVEHTPLTETLFIFLVAAILYAAVRAADGPAWWLPATGVLIGLSATVRPIGFVLVVLSAAWILWARPGRAGIRIAAAGGLIAPAVLIVGGYMLLNHSQTGFTGITLDSGRVIYARAAKFADCKQFTPPAGTAALCESTPEDRRGSFNQYLTGFPDYASSVTPAGRSISPAWRIFGPPPAGNSKLLAFGLTAIIHQPLDYIDVVATDFHYYWLDEHRAFIAGAARVDPGIDQIVAGYYKTGRGVSNGGLGFLRWYGDYIEVRGVVMIVLLLLPFLAIALASARTRRAVVLFACAGWLLPLASDAVASVDPRFVLPAYAPLAAAAAIGLGGGRARALVARAVPARRFRPAMRHP